MVASTDKAIWAETKSMKGILPRHGLASPLCLDLCSVRATNRIFSLPGPENQDFFLLTAIETRLLIPQLWPADAPLPPPYCLFSELSAGTIHACPNRLMSTDNAQLCRCQVEEGSVPAVHTGTYRLRGHAILPRYWDASAQAPGSKESGKIRENSKPRPRKTVPFL